MDTSADDVLGHILGKQIDKQDALQRVNLLAPDERSRVVATLKARLNTDVEADAPPDAHPKRQAVTRKPVHEGELSEQNKQFIETLIELFVERTATSKRNALMHQAYFVDQRKVAGLKRALKPMQYQLTYEKAEGAYLYDVDGNKYVDITGDQGVNFFGHQAGFITQALKTRLGQGYPLVGYSEDLFEAARLFCELTGHERMVYTQSGTEAVMWAVRMARAATGRKKVVIFDGSYHGLSDTVLAMRGRDGSTLSAGLGMLQEFADQLIIVDYGDMDHLSLIEKNAADIACVLTEPIQSRFPSRQPHEFVKALRTLTLEKGIVLIFDEMITGFRAGRKGAEAFYQVKPDLATYGKVAGGGMPTGIIAGLSKYMDYIDGGVWELDDASMPSLRRAVMAGTHTQNSLKVSASLAVMQEMQRLCIADECGPLTCACPIGQLNRRTKAMCDDINAYCHDKRVPLSIEYFTSLFRVSLGHDPYGIVRELLMILLKTNGVETSLSGNNFLNLAHTDEDARGVVDGFRRSVDTLLEHGFFVESEMTEKASTATAEKYAAIRISGAAASGEKSISGGSDTEFPLHRLMEMVLADLRSVNTQG